MTILQTGLANQDAVVPTGYQIERSLRFNSADSAYLSRTPAQVGNRKTWTWSGWVKLSKLATDMDLFGVRIDGNNQFRFYKTAANKLDIYNQVGGGIGARLITTQVFRDVSSWYHFVLTIDTTNAVAGDRMRLYVNGVEVTAFDTDTQPSQNYDTQVNTTNLHEIGGFALFPDFDGYLAEVNFIDGQALTPSDFGETSSSTGVWIPKAYTGSYGQNGFYLPFNDNSTVLNLGRNRQTLTADPYFPYTTLLLNGNGTNGAQNNTFIDSSSNNFTITRNGNTTQGTFSPFSQSGWSNYFDGNGDFLSISGNTNFNSTGDFTMEAWAYITSASAYGGIISLSEAVGSAGGRIAILNTGFLDFAVDGAGGGSYTSTAVPLNQWFHVAMVRSGSSTNNCSAYLNGIRVGQFTSTAQVNAASNACVIGRYYANGTNQYWTTGYISNARYVVGSALYSGTSYTVPTLALTAVSNTQLLTCQSNRFIDNSSNNFTITRNGDVSVQPFSPFTPTAAYSAATNGGSAYFDGTGDYLTYPTGQTPLLLGNSDFTIEAWVYRTSGTGTVAIVNGQSDFTTAGGSSFVLYLSSTSTSDVYIGGSGLGVTSPNPTVGQWAHVALVRTGGTLSTYLNGSRVGTRSDLGTSSINSGSTANPGAIGGFSNNSNILNGYISGLRLIKGSGGYNATSATITVPTAPPTAVANTSLLLNFTNAGIIDATGDTVLETVGNAQISTTQSKWGSSSMYFDGTGDYLVTPNPNHLSAIGNGDFTIEAWIYPTSTTTGGIVDTRTSAGDTSGFYFGLATGTIQIYSQGVINLTGGTISANTWTHVACRRLGSTINLYVNGSSVASTSNSTNWSRESVTVGASTRSGGDAFTGYIDDLRITRGLARYTGNFTVPAAQFAYNTADINVKQWVPTNLSVTAGVGNDSLVDSPTNYGTDTGAGGEVRGNYCTWNPLAKDDGTTLTNGNLDLSSTNYGNNTATFFLTSGKWYWEGQGTGYVGAICGNSGINWSTSISNAGSNAIGWWEGGPVYWDGGNNGGSTTFTSTDVVGVALDMNAGVVYFYKNGTLVYTITFGSGTVPNLSAGVFPCFNNGISSGTTKSVSTNFGQRPFAYTAPSGFKALCTQNLPIPTVGATSTTLADDYFNVVTYTGTGSSLSVTGVGFQPDFVWVKGRSGATDHALYDAVRGVQKQLESNTTTAETTETTGLTAFGTDGFTVGSLAQVNTNAATYVGWAWKANGAGVSNTAGSLTSTVSANQTAGISVVTYTIPSASATIETFGHGLGKAPSMVILKVRGNVDEWTVYNANLTTPLSNWLTLNTTAAAGGATSTFSSSSTTFGVRGTRLLGSGTSGNIVAYCFAEIAGFSKFGSYTGNGSADGPFIFTGFRPRFVLIKSSSDGTASNDWAIIDAARNTFNESAKFLRPNLSAAEGDDAGSSPAISIDILSNGFKVRGTSARINTASSTYIFAAFAEAPFNYSRAR